MPVSMLSMPLRHHERVVMIVFAAPTANSTSTVMIAESAMPVGGAMNKYGATGTVAPIRYDAPTTTDDLSGDSKFSSVKPSSSRIMTSAQRLGSPVMCATI